MKDKEKRLLYFMMGCICFSFVIVGATYAYFTAKATDDEMVRGNAATVTFGLSVEKITTVDMAFGLVPMKNNQAPNAARQGCFDDFGNAGCQMYKITVNADSDTVMFLDGYIVLKGKTQDVENRFTRIILSDNKDDDLDNTDKQVPIFETLFTNEDMLLDTFDDDDYIKSGVMGSDDVIHLNRKDDYACLFVSNEQIGANMGKTREFYVMIWVYDNGEAQDYLQGMELAYRGEVIFNTADGNQISATFD